MLDLVVTSQFKKDVKRIKKRGVDISLLKNVIRMLQCEQVLDAKFRDHALVGQYSGFRECHVQPDLLFIYAVNGQELILTASRTGSHSDLF